MFELADFERISLWEPIKDSIIHGDRGADAVCHIAGMFQIPFACQDFERHKNSLQIFKPGPGGDLESPNLRRNKLCQVLTTQVLPQNRHASVAGEGGSFMSVSSKSKERAFQICST